MARIRSIKPEFWSSPGIEETDPYARLLYIAMWTWADDNGVGVANPRELLGFAFPLDEEITVADVRRWLVEIRRVFEVKFYTVKGRQYFSIPSWEQHQKFDRRSKGKHPGPDEAETPSDVGKHPDSTESHESTPNARRDSVAGTGEQGNRGTVKKTCPNPSDDDSFIEFYMAYPRKENRGAAAKAYVKARKKVSQQTLLEGAQRYAADPNREQQFTKLPATWLNAESWADDPLPARGQAPSAPDNSWMTR